MAKVQVVPTALMAYAFTFQNYVRILGAMWVPMVLALLLIGGVLLPEIVRMQAATAAHDPTAALAGLGPILLLECVMIALLVSMVVGVTKIALGQELRFPNFHLAIGRDFWRLLGADIVVFLIVLGIAIAIGIVLGIVIGVTVGTTAGPHADPAQAAAAAQKIGLLVSIPIYAVMIFVLIRLASLLPPITISEKRLGIGRNWQLTKGNFWRLLGLFVLIALPLIILGLIQISLMAMFGGPDMNLFASFASPEAQMRFSMNMMGMYLHYWYLFLPLWIVLAPVFYGPLLTASVFAYRMLSVPAPAAT